MEERYKGIEKERDDLKRKCKEFEAKMDVLTRYVLKSKMLFIVWSLTFDKLKKLHNNYKPLK